MMTSCMCDMWAKVDVRKDKLYVSKLCVDKLCVRKLCVNKLCVDKLCDDTCVCVSNV